MELSFKSSTLKGFAHYIESKLEEKLRLTSDSDFWFNENFYDDKFKPMEASLNSFPEKSTAPKGNREKFKNRSRL